MTIHQKIRRHLYKDLTTLQQHAVQRTDNIPSPQLDQITNDYRHALHLTEQMIAGAISRADWQQAFEPLKPSLKQGQDIIARLNRGPKPSPSPTEPPFW